MPKAPSFPLIVRSGSVTVRIYRVVRPAERGRAERTFYSLVWGVAGKKHLRQFSDLEAAKAEAAHKADALAAGQSIAAVQMGMQDIGLLHEMRRVAGKTPPLAALEEWAAARALVGGEIMSACRSWKERNAPKITQITVADAVEKFIAAKEQAHKQGRTYKSKLKPLVEKFGAQFLHLLTHGQLETYLSQFENGVTRNDYRKRAVALFNWAKKAGHLSREATSEIELTDRGQEAGQRIGILSPALFQRLLVHFRAKHPEHLAALVLAGFCGIRSDEIHGKRADRTKRQSWDDIDLARGTLRVTVAKKGTAGYRPVPICPAAVKWLMLCEDRTGSVCDPIAIDTIRRLAREAKHDKKPIFPALPENCFRHSFCTYRLVVTGSVQQVAYEAGNSPALLRKHYVDLASKETAEAWFAIEPVGPGAVIPIGKGIAS